MRTMWCVARRGFTVIELLVVVVVIGILTAITIVAYTTMIQRSAQAALESTLKQAATKITAEEMRSGQAVSALPATFTAPNEITVRFIFIPASPGGSAAGYCVEAVHDRFPDMHYSIRNTDNGPKEGKCD